MRPRKESPRLASPAEPDQEFIDYANGLTHIVEERVGEGVVMTDCGQKLYFVEEDRVQAGDNGYPTNQREKCKTCRWDLL